ncbi:hypothetical protein Cgig2_002747 [Carnegiea gigantea]|uniref:P-type ATPase N-terminal domain-containing protein n=1 Tax=Carnegiea gigantea TaxID=171969 RepID=A0A9Q1GPR7_9CARY|nr:hypothetical protein Cgig2_002747 [Carnegiea gigantea]
MELDSIENQKKFGLIIKVAVEVGALKSEINRELAGSLSFIAPTMKRYVYINDDESTQELYCDNRISNRKYTVFTFLPKNLWEQFSRFMNQYFLLIACLQLWPLITPVNPASTWGPLIFIFAVSATKEAWDDYNRYLSDKKANEEEVWVVGEGIKKHIQAQDIRVGNIVWLRENDEIPCDLVLLGTSDPQGVCYVEGNLPAKQAMLCYMSKAYIPSISCFTGLLQSLIQRL